MPLDLMLVFLAGLLGSLGHCVGMCGGIAALLSARSVVNPGRRPLSLAALPSQALVHAGRLATYVILGGVAGLLGSTLQLTGGLRAWSSGLSLLAGLAMLALGLSLAGILPPLEGTLAGSSGLPGAMRRALTARGRAADLALGLLWGLLPCGLVYAMVARAATAGGILAGMETMAVFGLGTVPALLGLGSASAALSARSRGRFFRLAAGLVFLMGVQAILRGLAAYGLVGHLHLAGVMLW